MSESTSSNPTAQSNGKRLTEERLAEIKDHNHRNYGGSCEVCDLVSHIAALKSQLAQSERERDEAISAINKLNARKLIDLDRSL